jgi:hypothetical protein
MFQQIDQETIAYCERLLPEDEGIGQLLSELNENIVMGLKDRGFEVGCFRVLAALAGKLAGKGNEEQYVQVLEAGAMKLETVAAAKPVASLW